MGDEKNGSNASSSCSFDIPWADMMRFFPILDTAEGSAAAISSRQKLIVERLTPAASARSPAQKPSHLPDIRFSAIRCAWGKGPTAPSRRGRGIWRPPRMEGRRFPRLGYTRSVFGKKPSLRPYRGGAMRLRRASGQLFPRRARSLWRMEGTASHRGRR